MKYLYTTKPDEHCHEVEPGIWGRPAHTHEQPKLRKAGWVYNVNDLKEADHGLRKTEEEGREEEKQVTDENMSIEDRVYVGLAEEYYAKFGKRPHHKMKTETIRQKLEESDD